MGLGHLVLATPIHPMYLNGTPRRLD
jgi:hypothetical protein